MRRLLVISGFVATLLVPELAVAKSKPLQDLPKDLLRWSLCWIAIPQQMAEEHRDNGPLAAVALGPPKGTAAMVESTTRELWEAAKPDQRRGPARKSDVKGVIFRYEF